VRSKLALAAALLLFAVAAAAQGISVRLENDSFRVVGWKPIAPQPSQDWSAVFRVYSGTGDVPPLAGDYAVEDGSLTFHPRFPLEPGVRYRAVFQPPSGGKPITATFEKPKAQLTPTTRVAHVYPSSDVLPSNTLKLYIYFSAPMSRGEAWQHIRMLDAQGQSLKYEFVEIQQELWDNSHTRFTVLFDPGRIKRGVLPNEQLGPPIEDGKRYTLVVDRGWQDARGVPLAEEFRKQFRGGPADRTPPDPKTWRVTTPAPGSSADLVVDFPKPMDFALLQRMLQVSAGAGTVGSVTGTGAPGGAANALPGTVTVDKQETEWRFAPRQPWRAGAYRLLIDTGIEDLSGNHIGQPFDLDKFQTVTKDIETQMISLPFEVR
jgi:hypothetical protein